MEPWPIRTLLDRSCSNRSEKCNALPHGLVDYDTGWLDVDDVDVDDDDDDDDDDADAADDDDEDDYDGDEDDNED